MIWRLSIAAVVLSCAAFAQTPDLLDIAAAHVRVAEDFRGNAKLWGRIGEAEIASGKLLIEQLRPFMDSVEAVLYTSATPRLRDWELRTSSGAVFHSAVPAPFDARFPEICPTAEIVLVESDADWAKAAGKWVYLEAKMAFSPADTSVRKEKLYDKAVEHGAAGFIFSLPTPPGTWRAVVPVDKPFAQIEQKYVNGARPIQSFVVDAEDGARLKSAIERGEKVSARISYSTNTNYDGANVVTAMKGQGRMRIALLAHLDSFFSGANDDASGLAVMVGLAQRLHTLLESTRTADFDFIALGGHHNSAAGIRDLLAKRPDRFADTDAFILLEHLDCQPGAEGAAAGWPTPLNDFRTAYVGPDGWPEAETALPELVRETGLMTKAPQVLRQCIADLFVVCGRAKVFCLISAPPYYHTDHDTLDKLSRVGLENAVEFHMRRLRATGAIAPEFGK